MKTRILCTLSKCECSHFKKIHGDVLVYLWRFVLIKYEPFVTEKQAFFWPKLATTTWLKGQISWLLFFPLKVRCTLNFSSASAGLLLVVVVEKTTCVVCFWAWSIVARWQGQIFFCERNLYLFSASAVAVFQNINKFFSHLDWKSDRILDLLKYKM